MQFSQCRKCEDRCDKIDIDVEMPSPDMESIIKFTFSRAEKLTFKVFNFFKAWFFDTFREDTIDF